MTAPKLRFKEFDGDWTKGSFGKVASHISYGLTVRPEYIENGIKLISAREISTGIIDLNNAPKISESDFLLLSDKAKPQKYDLFLSKTGSIGFTSIVETDEKFAITQNIANIRLNNLNEQNPYFFLHQMRTTAFQLKAISVVNQSTIMDLQLGDIKKLEIVYPSKEEQTKIASFLSAVDEKINQLNQKHSLLSQYKQGMMQKLFSQQIRFKADDGSEFGEWENSYIGDVCKITTGNKDTQNKIDDGCYPFFVRSQTVEKINSYSMDTEAILTSGDGVGVGKNYHYINGKFDFHQRVYCLYEFSENLLGKYLYIYFSNYFYDRVKRLSAKNSVDSVRMDMISKMQIQLPCLEEQTKIANFLSAIDQKIEVVAQQIEQAKQWKKGLLQQMFV